MKYLQAHPKIKDIVARSFFTTVDDVERNLSMGAQTLVCSEFFELMIKRYGARIIPHLVDFFERYIGTQPYVGTEYFGDVQTIEFCSFLTDDSRDGVQCIIRPLPFGFHVRVVQLTGVFGVTTERELSCVETTL